MSDVDAAMAAAVRKRMRYWRWQNRIEFWKVIFWQMYLSLRIIWLRGILGVIDHD